MIKQIKNKPATLSMPAVALAANNVEVSNISGPITGNKLGDFEQVSKVTVPSVISWLIGILFTVGAITFFFILVMGGVKWLTSGGDEKKVAAARASITSALVGLGIVFASWAIIKIIEGVFGVSILQFSLRSFYGGTTTSQPNVPPPRVEIQ